MVRKIDEESERLLMQAHTDLLNAKMREEALKVDYAEAKNQTATAQFRLNQIVAEAKDPGMFAAKE